MVEENINEMHEGETTIARCEEGNYCNQYVKNTEETDSMDDKEIMLYYSSKAPELCDKLKMYADETEGWAVLQNDEIEVSRKDVEGEPMIGRSRINLGKKFTMKQIVSYLWDAENTLEYDNQLAASSLLKDYGNGLHILYHAFKGQWGFVGRDFVLYCWKKELEESSDRAVIGCSSVDDWPFDEENGMQKNLVRAKTIIAGYDISLQKNIGDIILTYIFQANLFVDNLPVWIMNKILMDHLNVIKNISACLCKKYDT